MGLESWLDVSRMDELGRQDTPVHRIDARAKTLTTLLFIVCVMSFSRYEVSALMPFFLYPCVLMVLGRIPAACVLKKILVAAPFALAVGLFNPFFDSRLVTAVGPWPVTGGWLSLCSILVRFVLTVSAALVLVACTGMYRLCAGLERMGVPRVLTVQLLFLYRYLFSVADESGRMLRGMELRAAGRPLRFRVYASLVGHLLVRSMARADRVYRAMLARGFDGQIRLVQPAAVRWADVGFVCGWVLFFVCVRLWNVADALGQCLTRGLL